MDWDSPEGIWKAYQQGVDYKNAIGLYEQVKQNENFFIGKQWEGLNAPDLDKPVINVLKRVVSYFISMIVSDDVSAAFTPFRAGEQAEGQAKALSREVERVIEQAGLKNLCRDIIRNAAVDGDGCLYLWFDPEAETGQLAKGRIRAEVVDNTRCLFGNPHSQELQDQPYLLLAQRKPVQQAREEARRWGAAGDRAAAIVPDGEEGTGQTDGLVTVIVGLWRKDGQVWAVKSTRGVIVRPAWNTGYRLYPAAYFSWDKVKNSCHGQAAITGLIPNQIAINQLFAMAIHSVKSNAFPQILYDRTKIKGWSNRPGQAIGVVGNPNEQVLAAGFRGADMSGQVMPLIDLLIQKTLEFMGASDVALGNVKPDNTSAIIATQKASAMPLELQKLAFYQFTEDYVRVLVDMIRADYGLREPVGGEGYFDFSALDYANLDMRVDIGSSAYYSELMQVQTLDNLYRNGIIQDAVEYLEGIPDQYIKNKQKLIAGIKERRGEREGARHGGVL